MPQVDFYVLAEAGVQVRHRFACRLAEQAFDLGNRVFLRTASPAESLLLDDLLWTFSDRAFLPHELATAVSPSHPKIAALIGQEPAPDGFHALLVNVGSEVPGDAHRFERIAEVIDADPDRKQQGRERFRQYRERGWTLETHNV